MARTVCLPVAGQRRRVTSSLRSRWRRGWRCAERLARSAQRGYPTRTYRIASFLHGPAAASHVARGVATKHCACGAGIRWSMRPGLVARHWGRDLSIEDDATRQQQTRPPPRTGGRAAAGPRGAGRLCDARRAGGLVRVVRYPWCVRPHGVEVGAERGHTHIAHRHGPRSGRPDSSSCAAPAGATPDRTAPFRVRRGVGSVARRRVVHPRRRHARVPSRARSRLATSHSQLVPGSSHEYEYGIVRTLTLKNVCHVRQITPDYD